MNYLLLFLFASDILNCALAIVPNAEYVCVCVRACVRVRACACVCVYVCVYQLNSCLALFMLRPVDAHPSHT